MLYWVLLKQLYLKFFSSEYMTSISGSTASCLLIHKYKVLTIYNKQVIRDTRQVHIYMCTNIYLSSIYVRIYNVSSTYRHRNTYTDIYTNILYYKVHIQTHIQYICTYRHIHIYTYILWSAHTHTHTHTRTHTHTQYICTYTHTNTYIDISLFSKEICYIFSRKCLSLKQQFTGVIQDETCGRDLQLNGSCGGGAYRHYRLENGIQSHMCSN